MSQGQGNVNFPVQSSIKSFTVMSPDLCMADEGSYFVAASAAAGVANTASTDTLAKTQLNPNLVIQNTWPQSGVVNAMNIYLRYIKVTVVAVPGGPPASWNYGMFLDNLTNKLTTAATVLTSYNTNSASGVASKAYISVGANTCVTGGPSYRVVGQNQFCGAIPVVLDQWIFCFGQPEGSGTMIGTTTLVSQRTVAMPPVVIAPGWFFTMGTWATSYSTATTYAWEIGYVERPQGQ
jgi:hypothetical protein